jgi:hypothetical protein
MQRGGESMWLEGRGGSMWREGRGVDTGEGIDTEGRGCRHSKGRGQGTIGK